MSSLQQNTLYDLPSRMGLCRISQNDWQCALPTFHSLMSRCCFTRLSQKEKTWQTMLMILLSHLSLVMGISKWRTGGMKVCLWFDYFVLFYSHCTAVLIWLGNFSSQKSPSRKHRRQYPFLTNPTRRLVPKASMLVFSFHVSVVGERK